MDCEIFQDEKADVILKYNDDESRSLKSYGELPETIKPNEAIGDPSIEEEKDEDMMAFDFNIDDI